jgi:hypothetical protein
MDPEAIEVMKVLFKHDPVGLPYREDEYRPEAVAITKKIKKNAEKYSVMGWEIAEIAEKYGDIAFAYFVLYFSRSMIPDAKDEVWDKIGLDLVAIFNVDRS